MILMLIVAEPSLLRMLKRQFPATSGATSGRVADVPPERRPVGPVGQRPGRDAPGKTAKARWDQDSWQGGSSAVCREACCVKNVDRQVEF